MTDGGGKFDGDIFADQAGYKTWEDLKNGFSGLPKDEQKFLLEMLSSGEENSLMHNARESLLSLRDPEGKKKKEVFDILNHRIDMIEVEVERIEAAFKQDGVSGLFSELEEGYAQETGLIANYQLQLRSLWRDLENKVIDKDGFLPEICQNISSLLVRMENSLTYQLEMITNIDVRELVSTDNSREVVEQLLSKQVEHMVWRVKRYISRLREFLQKQS